MMGRTIRGRFNKILWIIVLTLLANSICVCGIPYYVYATETVVEDEPDSQNEATTPDESQSDEKQSDGMPSDGIPSDGMQSDEMPSDLAQHDEVIDDSSLQNDMSRNTDDTRIATPTSDNDISSAATAGAGGNQLVFSENLYVVGFVKDGPSLAYTGGEVVQNLKIYYGSRLLKEGEDYFLIYRNNVRPNLFNVRNAPYVQIIMMGQYRGAAKLYYSIRMPEEYVDWGDEEATVMPPIAITPETTSPVETGPATEGELDLSSLFFKIDDMTYTGEEVKPDAGNIHVYLTREDMEAGIEFNEPCYVIESCHNNILAGRGYIVVRGIGNYCGRRLYYFSIVHKKLTYTSVTDVLLDNNRILLGVGENTTINATVMPEDAFNQTLIWSSSDTSVAEVSPSGVIYGKSAGQARIRVVSQDTGKAAWCDVVVDEFPEGNYVTPQMFLRPDDDGSGDVTYAFNKAIESLDASCDTLYVPTGRYLINADTSIQLKSNVKLVISPRAVLQAKENLNMGYNVIAVENATNVLISGGQIVGDRYGHLGSGGEWGHGIGIYDSSNVTVDGVDVSDCWGDGIYLGSEHDDELPAGCDGVTIKGCNLHNNRRNNLSIVCADNVTVKGCRLDGANGTAPQMGIDIETNNDNNPCEHIVIEDCSMSDNRGGSVYITTVAEDVQFIRCALNGMFVNYEGRDVVLKDCLVNGEVDARVGITLENTGINDKSEAADKVVVDYNPDNWEVTLRKYNQNSQNLINGSYVTISDVGLATTDVSGDGSVSAVAINADGGAANDVDSDGVSNSELNGVDGSVINGAGGAGAVNANLNEVATYGEGDGSTPVVKKVIRIERPSEGTGDAGVSLSLRELSGGTMTSLRAGFTYRFEYTIRGSGLWGIKTNQTGWYPIVTTESFCTGVVTYDAGSASSCNLMIYAIEKTKDMYLEIENIRIIEVR